MPTPITNWDSNQPGANWDVGLSWDAPPPPIVTGSEDDMLARLFAALPPWFGNGATPVLTAVMSGFASAAASVYSLIAFARAQTRISTATDGFLDLIALDFFGRRIRRFAGEADPAFQARILREIFRPRGTVAAIKQVLADLTGRTPNVLEPSRPVSAGGYGIACGYSVSGAYASNAFPGQVFVQAFRPFAGTGIPNVDGYSGPIGAYGAGAIEYASLPEIAGIATDADIFAAVASVTPPGVIAWTAIQS